MGWAALIASIIGAAISYYADYQAQQAARQQMDAAAWELGESQKKINDQITQAAENYDPETRIQKNDEEAQKVANQIKSDVAESQAIRDDQQATAGNVSNDYLKARDEAQQKTLVETNAFADLIGKIRGASNLRMNEGLDLTRTGQIIDTLARNARGNYSVRQSKAQDALHSYDGLKTAGQIIGAAGAAYGLANSLGTAATSAANAGRVAEGFAGVDSAGNVFGAF